MKSIYHLLHRGIILFFIGAGLTLILNVLQNQKNLSELSKDVNIIFSKWWLFLISGLVSAFIGLIYPHMKQNTDAHPFSQEWSHVFRCVAIFVGINEACTKIDFPTNSQLSLSLAVLSMCMWWYFDRSTVGFGIGITIAIIATIVTHFLVYHKVCIYTEKEFMYMQSWLPCVVFSGGITLGSIGKQLAINDVIDSENKSHAE